eukprot:jgi/Galph1/683/GphlegSOOS_G5349.1
MGHNVAKVLDNVKWPETWPYTDKDFSRMDENDDELFYSQPRLVYHIDEFAVRALENFYRKHFPPKADILDVCSSWVSHFPPEYKAGFIAGIGLNEYELSKNPRLDEYYVVNLQKCLQFPFEDDRFDIVTLVVSVDYLTKPMEVFREIRRVLRPGGVAYISFSNRCFPTKAVSLWLSTDDVECLYMFMNDSGGFKQPKAYDSSPNIGITVIGLLICHLLDPLYVVTAQVDKE